MTIGKIVPAVTWLREAVWFKGDGQLGAPGYGGAPAGSEAGFGGYAAAGAGAATAPTGFGGAPAGGPGGSPAGGPGGPGAANVAGGTAPDLPSPGDDIDDLPF